MEKKEGNIVKEKPRYKLTRYKIDQHYLVFDRKPDEALALEAWRANARATGRSAVGEPKLEVEYDIDSNTFVYYVIGKVIDIPNFKGKVPVGKKSVVVPERNV